MPYISKNNDRRYELRKGEPALNAGELNYQIFYYIKHNNNRFFIIMATEIKKFVNNFLIQKKNYQRYNDMTGCLVRCHKEIKKGSIYGNIWVTEPNIKEGEEDNDKNNT